LPPTVLALIADDRALLTVRGELDVTSADALRGWLGAVTDHGTRSAILDLSTVTFMSAAALHAVCDEQERLLAGGERLTVVCHSPQVRALFRIVELERVLDVVPTRAAADAQPPQAG
jgi:anti-sigma B factor antagonist